jgi:multidrug efflux pump subunit AcrA (membrane-fusion protein)
VQGPRELEGAAFEVANEGRRVLGCDRLSVLVRRGRRWRLLAASGASRVERRTDFSRRMERLADEAARWGDPISYPAIGADDGQLPPILAAALEEHIDHSHARELACAPIALAHRGGQENYDSRERRRGLTKFDVVLTAENFAGGGPRGLAPRLAGQLVELGELCAPALGRAAALDRFPVRTLLRWSDRLAALTQPGRLVRNLFIVGALAAAVVALVYVPVDLDVEAPATLATAVQRDVFASATGAVAEVRVSQGQMVHKGDVLIVLSDPELALKLQQTRGEIDAMRKRLAALAVTRTDRSLRENPSDDRLPLSAEQRQLEERLVSLEAQRQLLESRQEALALRSPLNGQVLTQDVQGLLESRPVERGQALLTIADTSSGWILKADVPQRQIGHVLAAQEQQQSDLAASVRLAGDVAQSYPGHVTAISAAAPLEAEGLEDDAAPVEVEVALDGEPPVAARPGMTASLRIHCGKRSLGYVWLHDVGATIYRWMTF